MPAAAAAAVRQADGLDRRRGHSRRQAFCFVGVSEAAAGVFPGVSAAAAVAAAAMSQRQQQKQQKKLQQQR